MGGGGLLSSLSGFVLRSPLVFNHSLPWSSFNLSRSLSLCFFDFFFLCWLLASCGGAESRWGGWRLLTLGTCSLFSAIWESDVLHSLCVRGKPLWLPGTPFWLSVWLVVLWNSVFVWKLGLRAVGVASSCPPLSSKSPFTAGCCCNRCSESLCLLAASLSCESKGTGRFC